MNAIVVNHPSSVRSRSVSQIGNGPRLVACSSVIRGKEFPLIEGIGLPIVIGANQACDYTISGSTMAEFHVSVECDNEDWMISVVSEGARLWVNNEPVQVALLEHGDQVQIGRHLLVFLADSDDAASDAMFVARAKLQARHA